MPKKVLNNSKVTGNCLPNLAHFLRGILAKEKPKSKSSTKRNRRTYLREMCVPKCRTLGGCGKPCGLCRPCGPCGPCKPCGPCGPRGPCGPGGPCGGCRGSCCGQSCCLQTPCGMVSYRLMSGPVGPVLPCMECCGCCSSGCCPPFYFVPNKCACCWEWGFFGPYY